MIRSFRSKGLAELWSTNRSSHIDARLQARIMRRLLALRDAGSLDVLRVPGFDFHALHGFEPTRYSIHVNGPWCLTFEFEDGDVYRLDLEQYH
ncbi:MAG: type II toxin-antitoxin system RelE/ParE family toxin [Devosia sp.]|nr:type II toxin-antitoxin system RelE/ParE family toxin [Devosia sp.]